MCFRPIASVVCVHHFGAPQLRWHTAFSDHSTKLSDGSARVTQEGVRTGSFFFFFLYTFVCPTFLVRCFPSVLSQEGFGRPFPSSTVAAMCVCLRVISVLNKIIVFRVTGWIASLQLIGLVHAYVTSLDCHFIRLQYI